MCFCLRRANRLIPNRFNFPLVERNEQRGFYDIGAEEEGLLHNYSDIDEEDDDAEVIDNQNVLGITTIHPEEEDEEEELRDINTQYQDHTDEEEEEEEDFGDLQSPKKQI
jgi:hypothetical protein